MKKGIIWAVLLFSFIFSSCVQHPGSGISDRKEVIMTYPFGEPDPLPIMIRSGMWGAGTKLYPYSYLDTYSRTPVEKEWTVVRMENPFIEVAVLPEVGGKIWGAVEKSTGLEFIYMNHVLKFRDIALRGPWTSGGIEFNFGIVGHTPSGAHAVDYITRKNADGSVSCVVGNLDLPSRTRWSVSITLPPDKAYFETESFWTNPHPLNQAYYAWMNGAVRTGSDLQYILPGNNYIGHDYRVELNPWPIDKAGRDLSWYRNNNFGSYKSYFTIGEYSDFFGGYWHDSKFGFGHWAHYDDVPGQKVWIWGLSRQGMIWENLLTDQDGQYSEPQAGRLLNQSDHEFFPPHGSDRWSEIWFPYKEIGPLAAASPVGAMNVKYDGKELVVSICPFQTISPILVVENRQSVIHSELLELRTMETLIKRLRLDLSGGDYTVKIGEDLIFDSNPESRRLDRPIDFHLYPETTGEGLFLSALRLERERDFHQALNKYLEVIRLDPYHIRALTRAAEIFYRRGNYYQAGQYARSALEKVMYDPDANFIFGLISRKTGKILEAKEAFGWAARSMALRSAAFGEMAEIFVGEGRLDLALEYAERSISFNAHNTAALQVLGVVLRLLDRYREAEKIWARIEKFDPLNHLIRFERYLISKNPSRLGKFNNLIRSEVAHEHYLEMGLYYYRLGLCNEASLILENAPEHPTVLYWRAFILRSEQQENSLDLVRKASAFSPVAVFPFRIESIEMFKWAQSLRPNDWKPKYYLALLFWGLGRIDDARIMIEECGTPDFAPYYTIRSFFRRESNPEEALKDLHTALEIDKDDWRNWQRLMVFLHRSGNFSAALEIGNTASEKFPDSDAIAIERARTLMALGRFGEVIESFEELEILPAEGSTSVHNLYEESLIMLSLESIQSGKYTRALELLESSREYPENLGSGKPYDPDYRLQDYLAHICFIRMDQQERADAYRKSIYEYTLRNWPQPKDHPYIGGMILRSFGDFEKGRILMQNHRPPEEIFRKLIKEQE